LPFINPIKIKGRKEKLGSFQIKWLSKSTLHLSLEQRYFKIKCYRKNNVLKINELEADLETSSIIFKVDCKEDEVLSLELPRFLLDSRHNDKDDAFFILVDGEETEHKTLSKKNSRKLTFNLPATCEEIEIIGTEILGISLGSLGTKKHTIKILQIPPHPSNKKHFEPKSITIKVGEGITWINEDYGGHMIISGDPNNGYSGYFHSKLLMNQELFELTFNKKGNMKYFCKIHPWEKGIIRIK